MLLLSNQLILISWQDSICEDAMKMGGTVER